jgi:NAD(P)H-hydrate epimerase
MGKGIVQQSLVAELYRQARQPMVIDADAINSLGESKINLGEHAGPRILTPHSGELVRLLGTTTSRAELEQTAVALAARHQLVFVLKGHLTLVTDGLLSFRNQTGNPGMATGGTGDVLTGIIGALLGQGLQPLEAARLAVHWHGLAGDLAAARFGQHSMIATDLIDSLGTAALSL